MDEFKFTSENNFSQEPERHTNSPITLSFKEDPKQQPPKKHSSGGKIIKAVGAVLLVAAISVGSGMFGAYLAMGNGETVGAKTTVGVKASGTELMSLPQPASSAESTTVGDNIGASDPSVSVSSALVSKTGDLTYSEVAAIAGPTVVEITTEKAVSGGFFEQYITSGAGSGVIISEGGYIITNNHVISGATRITVRLTSGDEYEAKLIGTDSQADVALLKIEATGLKYSVIGDSSKLVVGEEVIAIGNPLGALGGTVTNGIISALDREITVEGQKMTLLQTNAAINPGNSGGGLYNLKGELIAVVNAKSSGSTIEGLGFAIPINYAYSIANELLTNGYVTGRPALGISYIEIADYMDLMRYRVNSLGVYVYDGGNTELENGDRIAKIGEYEVSNAASMKSAISSYKVGDTVTITVVRNSSYTEVKVTLIEDKPADSGLTLSTEE